MELILVVIGFFGLVTGVVYFLLASRGVATDETIQRRLDSIMREPQVADRVRLLRGEDEEQTFWERVTDFFLGGRDMPANYTKLSRLLHQAGYRGERAVRVFWGLRLFLCIALAFLCLFVSVLSAARIADVLLLAAVGGAVGYLLPYASVFRKARARVMQMKETLPDTLDLLVVCVEAGMGMDAALNRVGKEQLGQGLYIGEELQLATQEMQAGAVRKEALNRLADRMGVEEFRALITFLTQTEELGGSIARSLRVYAETMRDKRSQTAEEAARKTVIKLIFPLVFFILPAIFILVLGAPALQIMKVLTSPL